jgi:hypothetical protein
MYREPVPAREVLEELMPKHTVNKQHILREYPITIRFLSVGCVVEVGCKSIPFENIDEAMKEINAYVANPYEAQEKWRKILD